MAILWVTDTNRAQLEAHCGTAASWLTTCTLSYCSLHRKNISVYTSTLSLTHSTNVSRLYLIK